MILGAILVLFLVGTHGLHSQRFLRLMEGRGHGLPSVLRMCLDGDLDTVDLLARNPDAAWRALRKSMHQVDMATLIPIYISMLNRFAESSPSSNAAALTTAFLKSGTSWEQQLVQLLARGTMFLSPKPPSAMDVALEGAITLLSLDPETTTASWNSGSHDLAAGWIHPFKYDANIASSTIDGSAFTGSVTKPYEMTACDALGLGHQPQILLKTDDDLSIDALVMAMHEIINEAMRSPGRPAASMVCPTYGVVPASEKGGLIALVPFAQHLRYEHVKKVLADPSKRPSLLGAVLCGEMTRVQDRNVKNVMFTKQHVIHVDYGHAFDMNEELKHDFSAAISKVVRLHEFLEVFGDDIEANYMHLFRQGDAVWSAMDALLKTHQKPKVVEAARRSLTLLLCRTNKGLLPDLLTGLSTDIQQLYSAERCFQETLERFKHSYDSQSIFRSIVHTILMPSDMTISYFNGYFVNSVSRALIGTGRYAIASQVIANVLIVSLPDTVEKYRSSVQSLPHFQLTRWIHAVNGEAALGEQRRLDYAGSARLTGFVRVADAIVRIADVDVAATVVADNTMWPFAFPQTRMDSLQVDAEKLDDGYLVLLHDTSNSEADSLWIKRETAYDGGAVLGAIAALLNAVWDEVPAMLAYAPQAVPMDGPVYLVEWPTFAIDVTDMKQEDIQSYKASPITVFGLLVWVNLVQATDGKYMYDHTRNSVFLTTAITVPQPQFQGRFIMPSFLTEMYDIEEFTAAVLTEESKNMLRDLFLERKQVLHAAYTLFTTDAQRYLKYHGSEPDVDSIIDNMEDLLTHNDHDDEIPSDSFFEPLWSFFWHGARESFS